MSYLTDLNLFRTDSARVLGRFARKCNKHDKFDFLWNESHFFLRMTFLQ
jgi:hypothetical protein